jgi:predicted TIM-barrel fold metal-dependent hydrolase
MLTRREALTGISAGALAVWGLTGEAFGEMADPPQPATPVNFSVPPNACDTHVHVFGDPKRYPYSPTTGYHHPPATPADLRAMLKALHVDRVVLIQPSAYGTDNSCLLDGLKDLGARARGVVAIDDKTPDADLDRMAGLGVRGVRLNAGGSPDESRKRFSAMAARLAGRKWHINTALGLAALAPLEEALATSSMPIVIDHFAGAQAAAGPNQAGLEVLVRLLKTGNIYQKISRIHNISKAAPDYADVAPIAKVLIAANPQRILWGTDWPHAGVRPPGYSAADISPYLQIDDGRVFNQFAIWAPDPALRKTILVDNPARLYGF